MIRTTFLGWNEYFIVEKSLDVGQRKNLQLLTNNRDHRAVGANEKLCAGSKPIDANQNLSIQW